MRSGSKASISLSTLALSPAPIDSPVVLMAVLSCSTSLSLKAQRLLDLNKILLCCTNGRLHLDFYLHHDHENKVRLNSVELSQYLFRHSVGTSWRLFLNSFLLQLLSPMLAHMRTVHSCVSGFCSLWYHFAASNKSLGLLSVPDSLRTPAKYMASGWPGMMIFSPTLR